LQLFPYAGSLTDAMKEELQGYRTSKGTLQFPVDKLAGCIVKKIVKARVVENESRKAASRSFGYRRDFPGDPS